MNNEISEKVLAKMQNGREYRKIEIANIETRDEDDGQMIVEGYATTFNEPYELFNMDGYIVREQIAPTAFNDTDMSDVIMQYDHEGRVFARTSNNTLLLTVDGHGLKIRANLGGTEIGRRLYEEIKGGYTNKMSFGFTVADDERTVTEDRVNGTTDVLRTITGIKKLYDVSAVSIPANGATEISARTLADGLIGEIKEESLKKLAEVKRKYQLLIALEMEKNKR